MYAMIRRSPLFRSFGLLAAAWLGVFLAEPPALHMCAAHAVHGSGTLAAASAAHAGHAMTMADGTMMPSHDAPAPGHHTAQCTCPGGCVTSGAVSAPATAIATIAVAPIAVRDRQPRAVVAVAACDGEHLLPFANGPPATA